MFNNDGLKRTFVALPIALTVIIVFLFSNTLSQFIIAGCYLGCLIEWMRIILGSSFMTDKRLMLLVAGGLYITLGTLSLFDEVVKDSQQVLSLLTVVCFADIGAYFIGRLIQGPKLAPKISPNKTWSGSIGGFLCAFFIALILVHYCPQQTQLLKPFQDNIFNIFYLVALIIVSQLGDLLESYIKRCLNIKDSGSIMPGHGGFLDRLDSILAVGLLLSIMRGFNYL